LPDLSQKVIEVEVSTQKSWSFDSFGVEAQGSCQQDFTYSASLDKYQDLPQFIKFDAQTRTFNFESFTSTDQGVHEVWLKGTNTKTSTVHQTSFKVKDSRILISAA